MRGLEEKGPMVSVIIPVYNSEKWIRKCIESVTSQSLRDLEIICINDGSTDGSADIIREYSRGDDRIILIDQENKGVSEARNAGLNTATGKYLAFVDSDDILEPEAIETLYRRMEERSLDLLSFNTRAFSNYRDLKQTAKTENDNYYSRVLDESKECAGLDFLTYLTENNIYVATVYNLMMLRSYVEDIGLRFIPGIIHEDEAFVFEAYLKARRVGCLNRILYNRRYRPGSIMTKKTKFVNVYGTYRVCKHIEGLIKNTEIPEHSFPTIVSHLSRLERNAVYKYIGCSAKEKEKINELPKAERAELEQFLLYPVRIETQMKSLQNENEKLKKKLEIAKKNESYLVKLKRKMRKMIKK